MTEPSRNRVVAWLVARPRKVWWFATAGDVVGLAVVSAFIGVTHGWGKFWCVVGAAALGAVQVGIQWLRDEASKDAAKTAEAVAQETRSFTNTAIASAFTPILRVVARMLEAAEDGDRESYRAEIVRAVVTAAASILGPEDTTSVRACYFTMEWEGDTPSRLRWSERSAGRPDEPRSPFEAGTPSGDAAIQMVLEDEHLFCPDTESDPPTGWDNHTHQYQTFLSVPVRGANQVCGMLSVDSLKAGDLVLERDHPILVVLARILALSVIEIPETVH